MHKSAQLNVIFFLSFCIVSFDTLDIKKLIKFKKNNMPAEDVYHRDHKSLKDREQTIY